MIFAARWNCFALNSTTLLLAAILHMALTSLTRVKGFLGISSADGSKDEQLEALRPACEAAIKSYLGRDIESATYTDYHSGNNTYEIALRHRPVTAITSVYLDDTGYFGQNPVSAFASVTQLTYGSDCVLDYDRGSSQSSSGLLIRLNNVWPIQNRVYLPGRLVMETGPQRGNIKVTYTAGYTTIPDDLQLAVCILISSSRRNIKTGGELNRERIGDYEYEIAPRSQLASALPEIGTIRAILARYRETPI